MKKKVSILGAIVLSLAITTSAFAATFSDIGNSYAQEEIMTLSDYGIINGYTDGTFKPTNPITREEFAKIICLANGLDEAPGAAAQFTDVSDWARGYVGALVKEGFVTGYNATEFGGQDTLTREQMATILIRTMYSEVIAAEAYEEGDIKLNFKDNAQIDAYAKANVALAQHIGLIKGDGTNFYPDAKAERQAVARLVYELGMNADQYLDKLVEVIENLDAESQQAVYEDLSRLE